MVRLIIVERIVKASLLIVGAITILFLGRRGVLASWALQAQHELNWDTDENFIERLIERFLIWIGFYQHLTVIAIAVIAYALLEGTEGVGLALRRRWAEYLTVLGTGFLIPYEISEVVRHASLLRVGALLLNAAVVVYLALRKRLFLDLPA